ncbi:MAG: chromosomal replication initiator protein DnaA [Ardenticatenia bacterium]|nr:chromosomal replication initiator protein DnaA [Ardenticatenia bacterium]
MNAGSADLKRLWDAVLGDIQLQMTRATFDTWMKGTELIECRGNRYIIGTPSPYAADWLENRLQPLIRKTLERHVGAEVHVEFTVKRANGHTAGSRAPSAPPEPPALLQPPAGNPLQPRYTFETFIVGPSNRLAHAAALAVAERPAQAYNPLFIYGGVGLGKTHLLHAIAHNVLAQNLKAVYVSSERFTNEFIADIRTQNTEAFRARYRGADVLLVDDIQFIAGKESTQEEFFHTFNALHAANRQIVISSDRPPRAIPLLEERLRSRFEGGLVCDIAPPDLETRIAILHAKAEGQPVPVPNEVIHLIAHRVQSNIRELEGALTRVVAYAQFGHQPLTVELAERVLQDVLERPPALELDWVIEEVARFYHLSVDDLKSPSRRKHIVHARQVAMYLAREETDASLIRIGEALGGRDHSTVLYGYEKVAQAVEGDEQLRREVLAIRGRLYDTARV